MSVFDPEQLFADQFERQPDGSYLYRQSSRGAPIPVTAAERDQFVATFARSRAWLQRGFAVAFMIIIIAMAGVFTWLEEKVPESWLWAVALIAVAAFLLVWRRLWSAPASSLERRVPTGLARSRAEVRDVMTERMGWSQIGVFGLLIPVGCLRAYHAHSEVDRWVSIAMSAAMFVAVGVLAFRKWRLHQRSRG